MNEIDEVKGFILSGGNPTWLEWCSWSEIMKKEAIKTKFDAEKIAAIQDCMRRAVSLEEALSFAEEFREFDGGESAKQIRTAINEKALK